jgi:hypothetical protein
VISDGTLVRHTPQEETEWLQGADKLKRDFLIKRGVELGSCSLLLLVRPCQGLMRRTDGTIEKRFARDIVQAPLQVTYLSERHYELKCIESWGKLETMVRIETAHIT